MRYLLHDRDTSEYIMAQSNSVDYPRSFSSMFGLSR